MGKPDENRIAYQTIENRLNNGYHRQELNVTSLKNWLTEASQQFNHNLKLPASININQLVLIQCIEEGVKNLPGVGKAMVLYDFIKGIVSAEDYNREIKKQAQIGINFIKLTWDLNEKLHKKLKACNKKREEMLKKYTKKWEAGQLTKKDSDLFLNDNPLPADLPDTKRDVAVRIFEKEFWRWFIKNHVTITIWSAQWASMGYRRSIPGTYYSADGLSQYHVTYLKKRFPDFFKGCKNPEVGGNELKILLGAPWNAKKKRIVCSQDPCETFDSKGRTGFCMAPAPFKS